MVVFITFKPKYLPESLRKQKKKTVKENNWPAFQMRGSGEKRTMVVNERRFRALLNDIVKSSSGVKEHYKVEAFCALHALTSVGLSEKHCLLRQAVIKEIEKPYTSAKNKAAKAKRWKTIKDLFKKDGVGDIFEEFKKRYHILYHLSPVQLP